MKVLFIGGTGVISTACSRLAVERGMELTLLTRGRSQMPPPPGARTLFMDINDEASTGALSGMNFDVVVDWVAYRTADIERDLRLFARNTRQFMFISSASAYEKPPSNYRITESTPLRNPYWQYSRDKISCEERLIRAHHEQNFPAVIVRPSLTYGESMVPLVMNSWERPYTIVDRIRKHRPVIVPGDGTSLWVITHATDFAKGLVGLFGQEQAIGQAFHITSDEVKTWNQLFHDVAAAAGAELEIVHVPSDFIASCMPEKCGSLLGDKSNSAVFDNSKIKQYVPEFTATTAFADGIRKSIAWFDEDPRRQEVDEQLNSAWDRILAGHKAGLQEALRLFRRPTGD